MATESVATPRLESPRPIGTGADLFLTNEEVLTVYVSRYSCDSPPDAASVRQLHGMVSGLARASIAITNEMIRANEGAEMWGHAADCVAFATMVLAQLANAAVVELGDAAEKERAA